MQIVKDKSNGGIIVIEFTEEKLNELKNVDIGKVDINTLVDIRDIKVNRHLKQPERILSYIGQVKNPYCFRYGEYTVKVSFMESGKTLNDCLKLYIENIITGQIGGTEICGTGLL